MAVCSDRPSSAPARSDAASSRKPSDSVKVAVRIRPASLSEKVGQFRPMIKVVDEHMLVFDPASTVNGIVINPSASRRRLGFPKRNKNLRYAYDHVRHTLARTLQLLPHPAAAPCVGPPPGRAPPPPPNLAPAPPLPAGLW